MPQALSLIPIWILSLASVLSTSAMAASTPNRGSYFCETATNNVAYEKVYRNLVAMNADPKSIEASPSSLYLAGEVIFPRAFPEKLSLHFDRDRNKITATYKQLATRLNDSAADLLGELLFRGALEDPLSETLWIDDFNDEILALPEVRLFRERLEKSTPLNIQDFEKLSDAIVLHLKNKNIHPLVQVHFDEPTRKWAWGEKALDQRADTTLQRKDHGSFVLLRTGNYGVIKITPSTAQDNLSLLGSHPANCKSDGTAP